MDSTVLKYCILQTVAVVPDEECYIDHEPDEGPGARTLPTPPVDPSPSPPPMRQSVMSQIRQCPHQTLLEMLLDVTRYGHLLILTGTICPVVFPSRKHLRDANEQRSKLKSKVADISRSMNKVFAYLT